MIVSNIDLSLLLSNKISAKNKYPSKSVWEYVEIQLIWPLLVSGGIFGTLEKSWMMTFTSEFVRKSLTGVRPDDPEAIPHTFVAIATSDVSQVLHMCFSQKNQMSSHLTPHLSGGRPSDKQDQAAYWRSL